MSRARIFIGIVIILELRLSAAATPSTEVWTSGTSDIQLFGTIHLGIDNYFTVARKRADGAGCFPADIGVTAGISPFQTVRMEAGIDLMEPLDHPLFFNAKFGLPENGFFKGQPSLAAGIFNAGTEANSTDFNIGYAAAGRTIPFLGRLFIGGYCGKRATLAGDTNRGITLAWDRAFLPAKSASGADFSRLLVCADLASGKNCYGGGGIGIAWYLTENISVLTGPVFFNDETLNGKWKWTVQLDITAAPLGGEGRKKEAL